MSSGVGSDPGVGLYFVPVLDPTKAVKVTRVIRNSASKILGIAPDTGFSRNKIEIRTQYAGSGSITLQKIRVIPSPFVLKQG